MEENSEEKKTSKISNMIAQSTSNSMGSQYIVHYSENLKFILLINICILFLN